MFVSASSLPWCLCLQKTKTRCDFLKKKKKKYTTEKTSARTRTEVMVLDEMEKKKTFKKAVKKKKKHRHSWGFEATGCSPPQIHVCPSARWAERSPGTRGRLRPSAMHGSLWGLGGVCGVLRAACV